MSDTMHLCVVDKLALATWEWVHSDTCCDLVMCGHHANQHRAQLEAQGFLCVKTSKVNA